jgi:opacity protein-like surface antigen
MTAPRTRYFVASVALTLLLVIASASPAAAQFFISPTIGYNFGGESGCPEITNCEDKNVNWGVSFGALGRVVGFEAEFVYTADFLGDSPGQSSDVLTFMGNFMLAPKFGPVQPYGFAGLGLMKTHAELTLPSLLERDNNYFGWDIGGGLIIFPGAHIGIRGDIRYFHAFQVLEMLGLTEPDTKLDYGRASAGVVFKF